MMMENLKVQDLFFEPVTMWIEVILGKDFTIFATTDGVVEFRKSKGDKTIVSVNAAEAVA